mmetsp:Transcript_3988/g.5549  ORF Transcript_3988/g.5549 Transcript_3988/m.5549 type:complete len:97 (-) Transcript_3988:739-1029(-)
MGCSSSSSSVPDVPRDAFGTSNLQEIVLSDQVESFEFREYSLTPQIHPDYRDWEKRNHNQAKKLWKWRRKKDKVHRAQSVQGSKRYNKRKTQFFSR